MSRTRVVVIYYNNDKEVERLSLCEEHVASFREGMKNYQFSTRGISKDPCWACQNIGKIQ